MRVNISSRSNLVALIVVFLLSSVGWAQAASPNGKLRFEITYPASLSAHALDGRMMLCISTNDKAEPRFQVTEEEAKSQQFFAVDVDALAPGAAAVIDAGGIGYPLKSAAEIPPGDYYVQAVFNVYETFKRADGHTVKLPPDMGEGQQWNRKPGNLFSKPQRIHIDRASAGTIRVTLTEKIPPIEAPKDTKYVKHFRMQSKLLSDFWGRPMYLGAIVVLPEGFDEHPNARYPLLIEQGHFPEDFHSFRTEPPKADMKGRERLGAEHGYRFYQAWTSGRMPKMLILLIQHATPFYDDSYAVNSANMGPYGDAILKELIPEVERRYRGVGQGWARALMGGSTGGWEALADQVFYPDEFNGTWAFCPDPIDFHAYQAVNLYDHKNAYWQDGGWTLVPRPEMRTNQGNVLAYMEPAYRREQVMGTRGRSTEQFDAWQAVFSPVGPDGYPKPIWDAKSGAIDKDVANYWKEHYDLTHIMQRDWTTLGPKLVGKLHITAGEMDTWYLNNAVHMLKDFLDSPKNAYKVAEFDFGAGQPHCYTGGAGVGAETSASTFERLMPVIAKRMKETAPAGADVSWQY